MSVIHPPAGYYTDPDTQQPRWWDGHSWGPVAPKAAASMPVTAQVNQPLNGLAIAAAVASAAIAMAAFGPWVTLGIIKSSGLDATSDAWGLVAAGAVGLMGAWMCRQTSTNGVGWLWLAGLGATGVSIYHIANFNERGMRVFDTAPSIGWGLYLGAAAGVVLVLIAYALGRQRPEA